MQGEIKLLLHLVSKVDPAQLDYRPTSKQRSTIELFQYLSIFGPIHLRAILADSFDMDSWHNAWSTGEASAIQLKLHQAQAAIESHSALYAELLEPCSDARLQE